ncbi:MULTISPECIES: copper resistance protein CopC [unclassified Bacillus (in: firmicutes)]|uniref:copper resistance CopC family protein n=1 Tax=unclassified Bacillus (in: firmicutes) TaxID=185979 RepID=UPI0008EAB24F|nr:MULTISPECIES: copper resistance protein CopC [unclassified Bacillus (in: firmicutes)]SFA80732.1 hypothetical protein SAMN02799634_101968 [Bacillus sp. UNCCL13]SFQ70863.1 hypothetical protein SAMN04488577_1242 [Bacillus sp. cl95]
MKRLFLTLLFLLVMVPTITSAHTEISSSNPSSGQVVTEDLKEIVLKFEGEIESLSTINVTKDGKEISLSRVDLKEKQMVGVLSSPLEDGEYVIDWSIAGEDGHPITGEILFSVQMEQKEESEQNAVTTEKEDMNQEMEKKEITKTNSTSENHGHKSSSLITNIMMVILLLILVFGVSKLFRRKR